MYDLLLCITALSEWQITEGERKIAKLEQGVKPMKWLMTNRWVVCMHACVSESGGVHFKWWDRLRGSGQVGCYRAVDTEAVTGNGNDKMREKVCVCVCVCVKKCVNVHTSRQGLTQDLYLTKGLSILTSIVSQYYENNIMI